MRLFKIEVRSDDRQTAFYNVVAPDAIEAATLALARYALLHGGFAARIEKLTDEGPALTA